MKRVKSKRFGFLLAVVMLLGVIPGTAFAAGEEAVAINETNFPDPAFLEFVRTLDGADDGSFSTEELEKIHEINATKQGITDLTGIEHFSSLRNLYVEKNQLTTLDVSRNTELQKLECQNNALTKLDLSSNTNLRSLAVDGNQLTALDVSHNTQLYSLFCNGNQLTELNLTNNPELDQLLCVNNHLTALDLTKNPKLSWLWCNNNQLTELNLNNPKLIGLYCNNNQLTALDVSASPELNSLYCGANQLTTLDVSSNPVLERLLCQENQLTTLDVSHNGMLEEFGCDINQLTALDVSHNPALKKLNCRSNPLGTLDVSQNPELSDLECSENQLTTLDVSHNPKLKDLHCQKNQLSELDLSNNPALEYMDCDENQLKALDVSRNTALKMLLVQHNHLVALDLSANTALEENSFRVGFNSLSIPDGTPIAQLPNFKAEKVLEVNGGNFDGGKVNFDDKEITYTYDGGNGHHINFTLVNTTEQYSVTVESGKATVKGVEKTKIAANTVVTLTANPAPAGKEFAGWEVTEGDIVLKDPKAASTTFEMPAKAVAVKATYKDSIHVHAAAKVDGQAPSCTQDGWKDYYKCDCGKFFEDEAATKEIMDLAAWKTGAGKVEKTGHAWDAPTYQWSADHKTCTATRVCKNDKSHTQKAVSAEVTSKVITAPTCAAKGTESRTATFKEKWAAAQTITVEIAPKAHSFSTVWKSSDQKHWHECSCGAKSDVAAHSWKWVVDKDATATAAGSKHEECTVCGYKKAAVEIAATGAAPSEQKPQQEQAAQPAQPVQKVPQDPTIPQTGDTSNVALWIVLMIVAAAGLIGVIVYRKKQMK